MLHFKKACVYFLNVNICVYMFDVLMCQSIDGKEAWQQQQSDEKKKKWFFYVCAKTKTVPSFKLFYVAWFAFFFKSVNFFLSSVDFHH